MDNSFCCLLLWLLFNEKICCLTYTKRWKASDWGCDPINDWSLSVESSRSVVTPNGKIGATVTSAAKGIDTAPVLGVSPPCVEWLFGSWNSINKKIKQQTNKKWYKHNLLVWKTYCWGYGCTCSRQRFTFFFWIVIWLTFCVGFVEWFAKRSRSLKWCARYVFI